MTNKLQQITTLALATILIAGSFSLTPFAYSTGWNDDDDDDDDHGSDPQITKGQCDDADNLLTNGCFETPVVTNTKKWDVYNTSLGWTVNWLIDANNDATDGINPCQTGEPGSGVAGYLELQKGILGGPSEGAQHAELDSDCNGPTNNARSGEKSSVGISQPVTTSEMNDYKITFAYKARPDQPLSTNGLMVSWNGDDITPNNLDFSKKKWKYASIIVSVAADQDLSPLVFEDTGNPDSFGTFLDDVSVKAIPKPVIKITLNKEIDNSQGGPITDPNAFGLKIIDDVVSHGIENTYTTAGTFTISEVGKPNYVGTLVASENCPFESIGDTAELELGDQVECTILNTFVPPPTITLKKAVTEDNTNHDDEVGAGVFDFSIKNIEGGDPIPITMDNQAVPPGTYTLSEDGPDNFEFVMITGDDGCPIMLDDIDEELDEFTLDSGEHLTCVVLNDDDADASSGGGAGIVFNPTHVKVSLTNTVGGNLCSDPEITNPCVIANGDDIVVIDDEFSDVTEAEKMIIVFSIIESPIPETLSPAQCVLEGLRDDGSGNIGFVLVCPNALTGDYAINYALINTE